MSFSSARAFVLCLVVLASFAFCLTAKAQDAKIRASLSSQEPVWVGQKVTVVVDLLAPGIFSGPVNFDLPDPKSVLLLPPDGHPMVSNETIDGTTYVVQRHELSAYPMQAGNQVIPAIRARFAFKRNPLDPTAVPVTLQTPELPFSVKIPPGAENLGTVISARSMKIEETWTPQPGKAEIKAGSAFTRSVTFSAPDVPGMIFPPFPASQVEGLGVYPKTQLHDESDRGTLTGERHDTITYVCERPGNFEIPAARFTWFDLDSQELRTKDFPARTFDVIPNPAMASAAPPQTHQPAVWPKVAAGSLIILFIAVGLIPRVRRTIARALQPFRPVHLKSLNP